MHSSICVPRVARARLNERVHAAPHGTVMEETRVTWRLRHLHVATASSVAQQKVTVVAFGDSITQATSGGVRPQQGWPMLLRAQLQQHFPWLAIAVVNAGVGGNTSREGLSRIRRDVLDCRPDFVTFEFGNVSAACSIFAHAYRPRSKSTSGVLRLCRPAYHACCTRRM